MADRTLVEVNVDVSIVVEVDQGAGDAELLQAAQDEIGHTGAKVTELLFRSDVGG